jgi:hypothetical protein
VPEPVPAPEPAPAEPAPAEPESGSAEPAPAETAPFEPTAPPVPPAETTNADPDAPLEARAHGSIRGRLIDRELDGIPVPGAAVELSCSCLDARTITITGPDGRFVLDDLPPGIYTLLADRGGPPTRHVVAIGRGQAVDLELSVSPPTPTVVLDRRTAEERSARTMLAVGGVGAVGALGLIVAGIVEGAKHECMFGLEDCARAPRPALAAGLGITGAVLAVGSGTLLGVGTYRLRKLRARIEVEDGAVAFVVGGRF